MDTQKSLWPIMRSCLVVIVTALCLAVCAGPVCAGPVVQVPVPAQVAEKATNMDVRQTYAVLSDKDLAKIRGCYDSYYFFGMDFVGNIDFTNGKPSITGSTYHAWAFSNEQLKGGTPKPLADGGVSFGAGNAEVSFQSSVGCNPNLGTGVIQLVQVRGNNNLVWASTNVTLNIQNLQTIKVDGLTGMRLGGLTR